MLIVFSKSPSKGNYNSIIEMAARIVERGEKVGILHIQDSCIAATLDKYCETLTKAKIDAYVLRADCQARGLLEKIGRDIKVINYKEWVKLLFDEHKKIVSWTT